jgi:diguanylate cyclase (GGDEF)-like protein/PAS domain S-box-containing protein
MNLQKIQKHIVIKDALKALLIAVLVWFGLFVSLRTEYQNNVQSHLHEILAKQQLAWEAAAKIFQRGVESRFDSLILQPEVLALLEQAQIPEQTQQARLKLYRLLSPYYQEQLRHNNGHFHLHFHTPDNRSFLRFHQPEKFADDLSKARPAVALANRTLQPVFGYETGKIISGFRHIFPIVHQGRHLGSVEFGQKFESLRREIALFNPMHEYTVLYKAEPLKQKLLKEYAYLYSTSAFSDDWLEEDPYRLLPHTQQVLSQTLHEISMLAQKDAQLNTLFNAGKPFARNYRHKGSHYALAFTPIEDVRQQNIAYLLSLSESEAIAAHHRRFTDYTAILTLIMVLSWLALWRLLINHRQKHHHQSYLQSINNTMSEGLYVTDTQGRITLANTAAQNLLEYSEAELLRQNAHRLFHRALPDDHLCPIEEASQVGESYQGELVFRNRRQKSILVSVSSQPLYVDGKLEGAVVSFTDITRQKVQDEALRIAATAFETQEGIMITDPNGRIQRVNKAFTRLTGFQLEEVVGQTPAILNSGIQTAEFYRDMWQTLLKEHFWQGEIWNKRKDGEIYLEWLTITAVLNEQNDITQFVANFSDVTDRHKAQEEIQKLAFYDPLTKLPNRRLLLDRLSHAILYTQRSGQCGALFFIDLDNFKTLNDSKGHMVGDLLLSEVAKRLTSAVREVDTVSRIGGDEFVILMENLGDNVEKASYQAEEVALKILDLFRDPFTLDRDTHHASPSIGVEIIQHKHTHSDEILMHADLAMYQAKKQGRNTVRFFDPQMQVSVEKIANLQKDLRHAIKNTEFELYFQPQVNQFASIVSAEALIRWIHPQKGFVSPADFIPLAEDSGLIIPIGDWVLQTACDTLAEWQKTPALADIKLAINVSAKQFAENDFVDKVQQALQKSGAQAHKLKLELTESMVVKDIEKTIRIMNALRDIGVSFALDDFGTGHSSLSYLKRLPLSQLKIDQSFTQDLTVDADDATIVKTIIAMSNTLKLEVIAEGVETIEQKEFLKENQCYIYQGYLFSRPLPLTDFENLVSTAQTIHLLDID